MSYAVERKDFARNLRGQYVLPVIATDPEDRPALELGSVLRVGGDTHVVTRTFDGVGGLIAVSPPVAKEHKHGTVIEIVRNGT